MVAGACDGDLNESVTDVPAAAPAATTASGTAPAATYHFDTDIQKDVDTLSCSSTGCHGGAGSAGFRLTKDAAGADLAANFEAFKQRANKGEQSLVLLKGTGQGHGGGVRFAKTDAVYTRWLTWINEGSPR